MTVNDVDHPITKGLAGTYPHSNDELYQNSLLFPDCEVLVTSWSDPANDPIAGARGYKARSTS